MAEVQARSQTSTGRGRGGSRGGRGGFANRSANTRRTTGDKNTSAELSATDDDGDIALLRKQYGNKLSTIKELFEDWSDADILYALKETDGDVEVTATRIAEGTIAQWGEVSKAKKPAKAKEPASSAGLTESSGNSRPARGGRPEGGRGGRARGNDRGRGSGRGRAVAHATTNGHKAKDAPLSVPTEDASAWGNATTTEDPIDWSNATAAAEASPPAKPAVPVESATKAAPAPSTAPKTWASMLRQSTAPPAAPVPKEIAIPKPAEVIEPPAPVEPVEPEPEPEPTPKETPAEPVVEPEEVKIVEPEVALPPSEDDLTKVNLDLLPDVSHPPATVTAASTTADSWDPRQPAPLAAVATPLSASQAQHQVNRGASGYVATALKATERPTTRMPSYQRRLLEQEEAVRMPGNREVDRAAVQFGAFSLNDTEDDIDGDREDPETRTQPPAESPAAPRASLPPVTQPAAIPDAFLAAQKPAAPQSQAPISAGSVQFTPAYIEHHTNLAPVMPVAPTGPASTSALRMSQYPQLSHPTNPSLHVAPQAPSNNQPYGRYPQTSAQEPTGFAQKPYDTFGQQTATSTATTFDSFPAATTQAPGPQSSGAFSSGPNDYSSYYDQQGRNNYGGYYGYNQQGGQNHHGEPNAANRSLGGYGSQNDNLSQYPQSASQQSRYPGATSNDAHNSGHNTPNPVGQTQQQSTAQGNQPQSNMHQQQQHSYQYQQHPYYQSPYYAQYMNHQPYGGYGQGGYGGPYGKGAYGQGHQYGMSPQGPFDHSSSTGTGGFGQTSLNSRESGLGSGINDYGRGGAGQQTGAPGALSSSGFGGSHDTYGRGSGFASQANQSFNATNVPATNSGSGNDDLKPYGDSKATGGPSPSLAAAARPGSTTNATPTAGGLPPPQSAQQGMGGYGGYPSQLGLHGNQSGSGYGLGGSGAQGHGSYGNNYAGNQGFGYYGGSRQQGGWGQNYGQQ
ncbi:hypothetical protein F5Y16DRAFT_384951 [Xylariaceae sp. FL0255]|nr:hypothetical protein F5Y16DRAFT_384951 [Xylariaceae sp. FL0255]